MRRYLVYLLFLLIFVIICGCSEDKEQPWADKEMDEEITVYELVREEYYWFVDNPSLNYLQQNAYATYKYAKSSIRDNIIVRKTISEESNVVDELEEGMYRINQIRVFDSLISFASGGEELKEYLFQNGISGEIKEVSIVNTIGLPVMVYVVTDSGACFITIDEYLEDILNKAQNTYTYRLYEPEVFNKKIAYKDGILKIDSKGISKECQITIHIDYAELPLIFIMEALGAKTDWTNSVEAVIQFEGKDYLLNISQHSLLETENNKNYLAAVPGGASSYYVDGNELWVDNRTLQGFFDTIGVKSSIDHNTSMFHIEF